MLLIDFPEAWREKLPVGVSWESGKTVSEPQHIGVPACSGIARSPHRRLLILNTIQRESAGCVGKQCPSRHSHLVSGNG